MRLRSAVSRWRLAGSVAINPLTDPLNVRSGRRHARPMFQEFEKEDRHQVNTAFPPRARALSRVIARKGPRVDVLFGGGQELSPWHPRKASSNPTSRRRQSYRRFKRSMAIGPPSPKSAGVHDQCGFSRPTTAAAASWDDLLNPATRACCRWPWTSGTAVTRIFSVLESTTATGLAFAYLRKLRRMCGLYQGGGGRCRSVSAGRRRHLFHRRRAEPRPRATTSSSALRRASALRPRRSR